MRPAQRLEFAPEEPTGDIDAAFFRLVEESGTTLDMATALAHGRSAAAIVGLAIPLVLFENLLGAAGGMVLGAAIPDRVPDASSAGGGSRNMRKQLPYALQAVADAVRSGQTLSEACELVSKEIKGPLGQEFGYAHRSSSWAIRPIGVMNRMVRRVPLPEFRIFATAVVVHRRAGGNLSLLTERMSKAAHDKTGRPQPHAGHDRRQPPVGHRHGRCGAIIAAGHPRLDRARLHRRVHEESQGPVADGHRGPAASHRRHLGLADFEDSRNAGCSGTPESTLLIAARLRQTCDCSIGRLVHDPSALRIS